MPLTYIVYCCRQLKLEQVILYINFYSYQVIYFIKTLNSSGVKTFLIAFDRSFQIVEPLYLKELYFQNYIFNHFS